MQTSLRLGLMEWPAGTNLGGPPFTAETTENPQRAAIPLVGGGSPAGPRSDGSAIS